MISVVIPAFNEEKLLPLCLNGLVLQKTKQQFEVILVDNNSTDKTQAIAKSFEKKLPLHIIKEAQKGRGSARCTGFASAKGNIILSTDADSIPPPDWIDSMSSVFISKDIVAVTGLGRVVDGTLLQNFLLSSIMPFALRLYKVIHHHYWLSGFNFGITKEAYEQSGGFSRVNGLEDIDLGLRVSKLGKIAYSSTSVIMSGRRFHKGLRFGLFEYLGAYVQYFFLKQKDVYMPDVRK